MSEGCRFRRSSSADFNRNLPYDPVRPWKDSDGRWYATTSADSCNSTVPCAGGGAGASVSVRRSRDRLGCVGSGPLLVLYMGRISVYEPGSAWPARELVTNSGHAVFFELDCRDATKSRLDRISRGKAAERRGQWHRPTLRSRCSSSPLVTSAHLLVTRLVGLRDASRTTSSTRGFRARLRIFVALRCVPVQDSTKQRVSVC